jgi:hypothetical protein
MNEQILNELAKNIKDEHTLQVSCVNWFRYSYPQHKIIAIPNQRKTNIVTGKRFKDEGVTKGALDLQILHPNKFYHGCFLELKWKRGKLTPEQIEMKEHLCREGYKVFVIYEYEQFKSAVVEYMTNYVPF